MITSEKIKAFTKDLGPEPDTTPDNRLCEMEVKMILAMVNPFEVDTCGQGYFTTHLEIEAGPDYTISARLDISRDYRPSKCNRWHGDEPDYDVSPVQIDFFEVKIVHDDGEFELSISQIDYIENELKSKLSVI